MVSLELIVLTYADAVRIIAVAVPLLLGAIFAGVVCIAVDIHEIKKHGGIEK